MLTTGGDRIHSTAKAPLIGPTPSREFMARGPNFVYAKEFVLSTHSADVWEKTLADLPIGERLLWQEALLLTGSYPFSAFQGMLGALTRAVGKEPEEETAQMYEFIADKSLRTIHKIFIRAGNPSFAILSYPVLWQRFFRSVEVRVPYAQKSEARLQFDWPAVFLDCLHPMCFGYSKKAIEMAGGSNLELDEIAQEELSGSIWRTTYDLRWSE